MQQPLIVGMGPDEEPDDAITLDDTDRPVILRDAHRVHGIRWMYLLELKAWVRRIGLEEAIGIAGSGLNIGR